jgi:SAM-dependent methyltransferase
MIVDDATTADFAHRTACEGTAMLWRGDFQNAKMLIEAMARRIDRPPRRARKVLPATSKAHAFHLHRQTRSQRARTLGMLLVEIEPDYSINLRRAPDVTQACAEAWGAAGMPAARSVVSLRELLGVISAHEWRVRGVRIAALGAMADDCIHPHYGVFSPIRGEYVDLVAAALLEQPPAAGQLAFDIGCGTGVLAALMLRRGMARVVATDLDTRAIACATENLKRLGLSEASELVRCDLFPPGRAELVVCNPPWLPARASSPLEKAVYDEGSSMLLGFLNGLSSHLSQGGEGWLILSDLAEHLGLRTRAELLKAFSDAGLEVAGRLETDPVHPKASANRDALHFARSVEVTSLWRLVVA